MANTLNILFWKSPAIVLWEIVGNLDKSAAILESWADLTISKFGSSQLLLELSILFPKTFLFLILLFLFRVVVEGPESGLFMEMWLLLNF